MSSKIVSWGDIIRRVHDKALYEKPVNVPSINPADDKTDIEANSCSEDDGLYESLEAEYLADSQSGSVRNNVIYNAYSSDNAALGQSIVCQIV